MTKEELKQEAIISIRKRKLSSEWTDEEIETDYEEEINGYIEGAEPREKRIHELEDMLHAWVQKYAKLESTKEELVKSNQTIRSKLRTLKNDYEEYETAHIALAEKYRELEKENERLKGDLELWESGACRATNLDKCGVVKELKAQIKNITGSLNDILWNCTCKEYEKATQELKELVNELEKEND